MPCPPPKAPTLAGAIRRAALLGAISAPACAAGGHFAVEDAALLDAGECQVDVWIERESRADRNLAHLGPTCGIGPVEVGLGWDRSRANAADAPTATSAQLKWATGITETVSIGVAVAANWQAASPRYAGTTLLVPISWRISDSLQANVNLGRDFQRDGPNPTRAGVGLEWRPASGWLLIAEQFRQSEGSFARAGLRWEPSKTLSIDLSRADRWGGASSPWWTLGLTWAWDRRRRPANVLTPTVD